MHKNRNIILLLLAICLVLLQAAAISRRSFWEDETATASLAPLNFEAIIRARAANNHPPLYWLSAAAWSRAFGYSEASLKSYSLIWLAVAAGLVFKLASALYDERTALIAVALVVLSPYVLTYGHNARYYAMSAAISLFLAWMAISYLNHGRWIALVFYAVGGVALLYTLYIGAALIIALNLWYLATAIKQKASCSRIAGWILAQIFIAGCYLPWLKIFLAAADRNMDQSLVLGNLVLELLIRFGYIGYAYLSGEFLSPVNPLVWLIVVLFILVSFSARGKALHKGWLPLTVVIISLTFSVFINLVSVYPQSAWQNLSNRTFFVFPFFLIWIAGSLANLKPKLAYVCLGIIFVVNMAGFFNYFNDAQMVKPLLAVPWRTLMQNIEDQKNPATVVVCSTGDVACTYYLNLYELAPAEDWSRERILSQPPSDLWWIQNNLGAPNLSGNQSVSFVDQLAKTYREFSFVQYAPQDQSIRTIKTNLFGQVDYEYRVSVYHFLEPAKP
jgi:4-amino-4-deoxy-L-arabinose transferase-like glycosyltransferase